MSSNVALAVVTLAASTAGGVALGGYAIGGYGFFEPPGHLFLDSAQAREVQGRAVVDAAPSAPSPGTLHECTGCDAGLYRYRDAALTDYDTQTDDDVTGDERNMPAEASVAPYSVAEAPEPDSVPVPVPPAERAPMQGILLAHAGE